MTGARTSEGAKVVLQSEHTTVNLKPLNIVFGGDTKTGGSPYHWEFQPTQRKFLKDFKHWTQKILVDISIEKFTR